MTVISVDHVNRTFTVMLIQYTQERVIMTKKNVGVRVNLEVDQMGKYVENVVLGMLTSSGSNNTTTTESPLESLIGRIVDRKLNKIK